MLKLAQPHILSLEKYSPGRAIEISSHIPKWAKLGSNENCLGPSKMALQAVRENLYKSHLYPTAKRSSLVEKLCEHFKQFHVKKNQIALGNGTSELIVNLVRSLLGPEEALLHCWPTFIMYPIAAHAQGRERVVVPVKDDMSYDVELILQNISHRKHHPVKLVFLANPNNPTGKYLNHDELSYLVKSLPNDVVLVIDEAYFEYVTNKDFPNGLVHALSRPRTIILRTFSKIYGLAGMRIGYAIGDADIIDLLCRIRDAFNVNAVAQDAAFAALDDHEHVQDSVHHVQHQRPVIIENLKEMGFYICHGVGNFVMARRSNFMPSVTELCNRLFAYGVIIRPLQSFGASDWVRISIGTRSENVHLFEGLSKVLSTNVKSIAAS